MQNTQKNKLQKNIGKIFSKNKVGGEIKSKITFL